MACVDYSTTADGRPRLDRAAAAAERRYLAELETITDKRCLKAEASEALIKWLCEWGFTAFWSLTFNPHKFGGGVSADKAFKMWHQVIVENLNQELYGHNYRRAVGHSYFSYVLGIEPHKSGALHMHACTTGRTHWSKACELWQGGKSLNVGTIEIRPIGDSDHDVRYTLKYVAKGGEVRLFRQSDELKAPHFEPLWFRS